MVSNWIWVGFWLFAVAFYAVAEHMVYAGVHP